MTSNRPEGGAKVVRQPYESIDSLLKRLKKSSEGVLGDYKKHQHFLSPGQRRRAKSSTARYRRNKSN
jgi:ribosomal protein S21